MKDSAKTLTHMDFTEYTRKMDQHDAIIKAYTKLNAKLQMAQEIKEKTAWMKPDDRARLCGIIDDIWRQEQVNCEAVEELNK